MAMLAGPRQRKRYNLVPKGKALFEDGDRFGTKMLEKMGWTKGKGLGSRENGQQEFIRIRYKNDANGLGYEDRDDQWTEHEKHFNGLLESLHAGDSNSNTASADDADECAPRVGFGFEGTKTSKEKLKDKFSGQSLEERSKKSKARVHYKKFTKGKDMSQYSEKDLANIFGKKATAEDNDFYSQLPSFNAGNEGSDAEAEEKPAFELGTHTINTGLSVEDYFKMKMEALKNKKSVGERAEEVVSCENGDEDNVQDSEAMYIANEEEDECAEGRKKKKKSKRQQLEDASEKENGIEENSVENKQVGEICETHGKDTSAVKSKKKKNKKASLFEPAADCTEVITVEDEPNEEQRPKKKKKKKSADEATPDHFTDKNNSHKEIENDPEPFCENGTDCAEIITVEDEASEEERLKKKRKKKSADATLPEHVTEESNTPTKKKDWSKCERDGTECAEVVKVEDDAGERKRSKKKKKNALAEDVSYQITDQTPIAMENDNDPPSQIDEAAALDATKKKKNKKTKTEDNAEQESTEIVVEDQSQKKKKSKKRNAEETTENLENDASDNPRKKKKSNDPTSGKQSENPAKKNKTKPQTSHDETAVLSENTSTKSKKKPETEANIPATANPAKVSSQNEISRLTDCCLDTYKISTFCAEKFRNVDLASFKGSNLSQQNGYGLSENLELKIVNISGDQERITKLWSGTSNKYKEAIPKQEIYRNYMTKVKQARGQKKKIPKMKVRTFQRRNAFQAL